MFPCVCPSCWLLISILSSRASVNKTSCLSLLSGRVCGTSPCPADLDMSHLEVAGVDPGAGHCIHRPVQQALVLLQLGGLVLVQDELYDLRAHLEPPPQVLLHHLLQHVLHAHHLLLHGCRKLSQTSSWPSCQADLVLSDAGSKKRLTVLSEPGRAPWCPAVEGCSERSTSFSCSDIYEENRRSFKAAH